MLLIIQLRPVCFFLSALSFGTKFSRKTENLPHSLRTVYDLNHKMLTRKTATSQIENIVFFDFGRKFKCTELRRERNEEFVSPLVPEEDKLSAV